MNMLIEEVS